ncbi:MAG: S-layer family protein [Cyanobacteria bacterium P01_D01_bin.156]
MKDCLRTALIAQGIVLAGLGLSDISLAQVIPDASLPIDSLVDFPGCNTLCTITGGTAQGANLFHSFSEFSLPTGGVAAFDESLTIETIIGRVTSDKVSNIDGTLRSNQANLFLLNPNGFIFGPNAALDVGGAFVATTAESIQFQDGTNFRVADAAPLLSVSTPVGLQLGEQAGIIQVGTTATPGIGNQLYLNPNGSINRTDKSSGGGLAVDSGQTLALLANGISLVGGNLAAPEGHIDLGSVSEPAFISIEQTNTTWQFDYSGVDDFGDITLTQAASVDVSGDSSGSLQIIGNHIDLADGSALIAETLGNGIGGFINVQAKDIKLEGISSLAPPASPPIPGLLSNLPLVTGIFANVALAQSGEGSDLTINTQSLTVTDGAQVTAATFGAGASGNLTVNAQDIRVSGGTPGGPSGLLAAVAPRTPIYGDAGQTLVDAGLAELRIPPNSGSPLLFALPPVATGNSGNVTIETQSLVVEDGAQIYSRSAGLGNAGSLHIQADTIDITGSNLGGPSTLQASAETPIDGAGNASDITINTRLLNVSDGGQISTGTQGPGDGGNVLINATESVSLSGNDEAGRSGIFSSAISLAGFSAGTGQGGNVTVNTPYLEIREGANISASNFPSTENPRLAPGTGAAGTVNLNIQGDEGILLLDEGEITAASLLENGGNINLDVQDILLLRNESHITARAGTGGAGGNINITTPFLVAIPNEDSDIIASALNGPGGNIVITASSILSLQERPAIPGNGTNDIDASSQFGLDGTVTIQNPELDPGQGLTTLPTNLIDRSTLFSQSCGVDDTSTNYFTLTGRGGVPSHPGYTLEDSTALADLGSRSNHVTNSQIQPTNSDSLPKAFGTTSVVEARSWTTNDAGEPVLIARANTAISQTNALPYASC